MTHKERFINALECRQPLGRVPHFELVFFLTMEAFGKVHPIYRNYGQWGQMSETERILHRRDIADVYVQIAREYEHSAIFFHPPQGWTSDLDGELLRTFEHIHELSNQDYFLMMHGDATYEIPQGDTMMSFVSLIADDPQMIRQIIINQHLKRRYILPAFFI